MSSAAIPSLRRGLLVALLLLGVAELAARLAPVPSPRAPEVGEAVRLEGNPWLLWELVPGTHREQGVTVEVNAEGLRGAAIGDKRGERWMTVGDSSIYGFGVEEQDVFTARLAAARGVEVINAAVPGYSTYQTLNQLRMRTLALAPDVLVVGSLWSDNNFDRFVDAELLASYAGWEASPSARARSWLNRSALFSALDWALRVGPQAASAKTVGWQLSEGGARSDRRRVAINDYAANLDTLCRLMEGRPVVYLLLPNREDLSPHNAAPAWVPYRDVMRDAAARCGAPLVDMTRVFSASGETTNTLFLDQMHPSPSGHALISRALQALTPAATHDPGPRRLWTDPFARAAPPAYALTAQLIVPQFRGGRMVVDVLEGERIVATGAVPGPGNIRIALPSALRKVSVRVTVDAQQDGVAGDPSATIEVNLPVERLDFATAKLR